MKIAHQEVANIGIMPLEAFKKYTLAIAKGERKPTKDAPKIWFPSISSLARVLSEENQALLKLVASTPPKSIKALEKATGRKANNLLRTLRTMENYGLVKLIKGEQGRGRAALRPQVLYHAARIEISFL